MEFLKELISEDLYNQLNDALKDKKVKLANIGDGSYLPRAKFNEVNEALKQAKEQLVQLSDYESKIVNYESDFKNLKQQLAVSKALAGLKSQNNDIVAKLIDFKKIEFDDNNQIINGFFTQIDSLRKEAPYLFSTDNNILINPVGQLKPLDEEPFQPIINQLKGK